MKRYCPYCGKNLIRVSENSYMCPNRSGRGYIGPGKTDFSFVLFFKR